MNRENAVEPHWSHCCRLEVKFPRGSYAEGRLDNGTVIGRTIDCVGNRGNLSWMSVSDPGTLHDLGFKDDFVAGRT
jgi:hypothetical protein